MFALAHTHTHHNFITTNFYLKILFIKNKTERNENNSQHKRTTEDKRRRKKKTMKIEKKLLFSVCVLVMKTTWRAALTTLFDIIYLWRVHKCTCRKCVRIYDDDGDDDAMHVYKKMNIK